MFGVAGYPENLVCVLLFLFFFEGLGSPGVPKKSKYIILFDLLKLKASYFFVQKLVMFGVSWVP